MRDSIPDLKNAIRFCNENRIAIEPDPIFDRDRDRDCDLKIGERFQNEIR